jgi:hypothetical protein
MKKGAGGFESQRFFAIGEYSDPLRSSVGEVNEGSRRRYFASARINCAASVRRLEMKNPLFYRPGLQNRGYWISSSSPRRSQVTSRISYS